MNQSELKDLVLGEFDQLRKTALEIMLELMPDHPIMDPDPKKAADGARSLCQRSWGLATEFMATGERPRKTQDGRPLPSMRDAFCTAVISRVKNLEAPAPAPEPATQPAPAQTPPAPRVLAEVDLNEEDDRDRIADVPSLDIVAPSAPLAVDKKPIVQRKPLPKRELARNA